MLISKEVVKEIIMVTEYLELDYDTYNNVSDNAAVNYFSTDEDDNKVQKWQIFTRKNHRIIYMIIDLFQMERIKVKREWNTPPSKKSNNLNVKES